MQNSTQAPNVLRIVDWVDSNEFSTPEDVLERALDDYRDSSPEDRYNKIMVLTLSNTGGDYESGYYAGNMSSSEMVALLSVIQHRLLASLSGLSE